jgi:hypothetical protein
MMNLPAACASRGGPKPGHLKGGNVKPEVRGRNRLGPVWVLTLIAALGSWSAGGRAQTSSPIQGLPPASTAGSPPPAQEFGVSDVPAHLAVVQGTVTLERESQAVPAEANAALLAGDRLRTAQGRAEVLFADGSALDLDEFSSVDLLSDSLVRLREGRLRLAIARLANEIDYRIDAAGSSASIHSAGDFRVEIHNARGSAPEIDLAVIRGTAELENAHGRTLVRAGTHATALEDREPSIATSFNSSAYDDFDRWVEDQRDARVGTESPQYLPSEMRSYGGVLDTYGSWQYEASYGGTVWYPQVGAGWQPYYDGHWSFVGSYGWFWIGASPWVWPTHHYGRWGMSGGGRWFWMPGHSWSPAWVSWMTGPDFVSWCPLGIDNRPVVGFHGGRVGDVGRGWTSAPAQNFKAHAMNVPRGPMPTPLRSPTVTRPAAAPLAATSQGVPSSPGGATQPVPGALTSDGGPRTMRATTWPRTAGAPDAAPAPRSPGNGTSRRPDWAPPMPSSPGRAFDRTPAPPSSAPAWGSRGSPSDAPSRGVRPAEPAPTPAPPTRTSGSGVAVPRYGPSAAPPAVARPTAPSSAGRGSSAPPAARGGGGRGRGSDR